MSNIFIVLMIIAMLAVLVSLGLGIFVMVKGGETNRKYGNKLMQARIYLQGFAIAMFIMAFLVSNSGGNQ